MVTFRKLCIECYIISVLEVIVFFFFDTISSCSDERTIGKEGSCFSQVEESYFVRWL